MVSKDKMYFCLQCCRQTVCSHSKPHYNNMEKNSVNLVPLQTAFLLLNVILLHEVHTDRGMCKMQIVLAVYRATIHWNIFPEFQSLAYLCHTILNGMKSDEALIAETNFVFQVLFLLQSSLCCLRDLYDDGFHQKFETWRMPLFPSLKYCMKLSAITQFPV